jgi:hypothetical protein
MVEFEYQPWNRIIVHEVVKYPLEHFLATHTIGVQDGGVGSPLMWAFGFVFDHIAMPPTEDVIKEQIEGRIHWSSLAYGIMTEYKENIIRPGRITVPIVDLSNNKIYRVMSDWIKEEFEID